MAKFQTERQAILGDKKEEHEKDLGLSIAEIKQLRDWEKKKRLKKVGGCKFGRR